MQRFKSFKFLSAVITSVGLFAGILFGNGAAQAATIPDTITVTWHYYREDAEYAKWTIYTWKNRNSGSDSGNTTDCKSGSTDAFGGVYTCTYSGLTGFDNLGFIVRYNSTWDQKDWAPDRFIDSFDQTGKAEVWIFSGQGPVYTTPQTAPVFVPRISSASFSTYRKFAVTLNQRETVLQTQSEGFTLSDGTSDVPITAATAQSIQSSKSNTFELEVGSDIDLTKSYTVSRNGYESSVVSVSALYDTQAFTDAFTYTGDDLGNTLRPDGVDFRVWAPTASAVSIMRHASASEKREQGTELAMTRDVKGTWIYNYSGSDGDGFIYDYKVAVNGKVNYASDPYARASTIDSSHSVVVDLSATDPDVWAPSPSFGSGNTDAIIYELQVRDLSSRANSGIPVAHRKKFLGLTDLNTSYSFTGTKTVTVKGKKTTVSAQYSTATGVSAIKQLGVTHVELLPVYDFNNVGEGSLNENEPVFNWGYDPVNYNVPDGGFSSDAANPTARITELKAGIQTLHQQGLRTIMDVVYNHVSDAASFSEELIVPGYFFRHTSSGALTSSSGCGNDVNSERSMVRKFIVDSVVYWAKEYHFDGFRFDLMGLLDVTTMAQVRTELDKIDPSIIVIGEGWRMTGANDPANQRAASRLPNVAFFNDQIRDSVKGNVFSAIDPGYVQGEISSAYDVVAGIYAQTRNTGSVVPSWLASNPGQSVNYVEAHDNLTLWDKLDVTTFGDAKFSKATYALAADRQAAAIVFTAQGIPFMQAGQEFLRTKGSTKNPKADNSYASSDAINGLNWSARALNESTVKYYAGLIALRRTHGAFRMASAAAISANVKHSVAKDGSIKVVLNGRAVGDSWNTIVVVHNPNPKATTVTLPRKANWSIVVSGSSAGVKTLSTLRNASKVTVPALSSYVLHD